MTREEAREELIEEWNEFIDGCGLRGIEEKEAKRNPDFKKVYEANLMAIQALEQEPKTNVLDKIREEIKSAINYQEGKDISEYSIDVDEVLQIIDKYKAESEDKE